MKNLKILFKKKSKGIISANFTPLGFLAFLFLSAIAAYNTIPLVAAEMFENRFEKSTRHLDNILEGIMGIDGYIHNTVAPCSTTVTTVDISAKRVNDCNAFANYNLVDLDDADDDTDGAMSYYLLLSNYGTGCKIYFSQHETDLQQFYMYTDCGLSRKNDVVERRFRAHLKENYDVQLRTVDLESVGLDNDTGGTTKDGKARFMFRK